MHVYILRGHSSPGKRALEQLLTGDAEGRFVCFAPTTETLEDATSARRIKFLNLICAKAPIIVVSDFLKTQDECDEFTITALNHDYQVTSIVVEGLSTAPRPGRVPLYEEEYEIQLHPDHGVLITTDRCKFESLP